MNDPDDGILVTIDLENDPPVTPQEIQLLADLLPVIVKDILQRSAESED